MKRWLAAARDALTAIALGATLALVLAYGPGGLLT